MPPPLSVPLPPRVAVLDNDQVFLTLLRDVLTDAGYAAWTLRVGIGAHEVLRTLAPAALILDLPAADADDVLAWGLLALCARDAALRRIPLIACAPDDGHASDRAAALRHPVCTLVCKPFTLDALLAPLERLCGRRAGAHAAHTPPSSQACAPP